MQQPKNLYELVDFERSLKDVRFSGVVKLNTNNKNYFTFINNGVKYYAPRRTQFVHLLLSRMYGEMDYKQANAIWNEKILLPEFENEINTAIKNKGLILRTYSHNNENYVYGIVTPQFRNINQLEFREKTHKAFKASGIDVVGKLNGLEERFTLPVFNDELNFELIISYARNNGYHGFRTEWERIIRVCSNGLTRKLADKNHLIHRADIDFNNFISNLVRHGIHELGEIGKQISLSKSRHIDPDTFNPLFSRLHLAEGLKERIVSKFHEEKKLWGNSEWALSQAFTWMGTHDKYSYPNTRMLMRETGTSILESSLDDYLTDLQYIIVEFNPWGNTYKSLLPENHEKVVLREYWQDRNINLN